MNQVFNQVLPNKTSSNILSGTFMTPCLMLYSLLMFLCIPKKWINKYIALNMYMEFAFKKVKAISFEGKLSRPLPLFYSIV